MKEILLKESGLKAFIKESVSFGEYNSIDNSLLHGAHLESGSVNVDLEKATERMVMKKMSVFVDRVLDKDGKEINVTNEFINGLSVEDGFILQNAVNEAIENIKKKLSQTS